MGRIDDSLAALESIEDGTERAFQLSGLISTLFKIRGIMLIVTGQLAFDSYANSTSPKPDLEMAPMAGKLTPRIMQEIMVGQLRAKGLINRWTVARIPIRFHAEAVTGMHGACRDFMTEHGVVKLFPAEDILAERILAAVYPVPDAEAHTQARLLLINGLTEAFQMDWPLLQHLCHQPDYRVGDDLAKMRAAAKKDVDSLGIMPDPMAHTPTTTSEAPTPMEAAPKKRDRPGDELSSLY